MIIYKELTGWDFENRFEIDKNENGIIPVYSLIDNSIQEVVAETTDFNEMMKYVKKNQLRIAIQPLN